MVTSPSTPKPPLALKTRKAISYPYRTGQVIEKTAKLLVNPEIRGRGDFLLFSLQELNWRARCQEACLTRPGDSSVSRSLEEEGEVLLDEFRQWSLRFFSEKTTNQLVEQRWRGVFKALERPIA
jgi:hypothetical protein